VRLATHVPLQLAGTLMVSRGRAASPRADS
jgi:hypothetical protein